jgi:hypothetical protein
MARATVETTPTAAPRHPDPIFEAVADAEGNIRKVYDLALILNDYATKPLLDDERRLAMSHLTGELVVIGRGLAEMVDRAFAATAQGNTKNRATSVADLCREWRLVQAKLAYDLAALQETDDDGTARIIDAAGPHISEIEQALAESDIETLEEAQLIVNLVLKNMREKQVVEEIDLDMLAAVRKALPYLKPEPRATAAD